MGKKRQRIREEASSSMASLYSSIRPYPTKRQRIREEASSSMASLYSSIRPYPTLYN